MSRVATWRTYATMGLQPLKSSRPRSGNSWTTFRRCAVSARRLAAGNAEGRYASRLCGFLRARSRVRYYPLYFVAEMWRIEKL